MLKSKSKTQLLPIDRNQSGRGILSTDVAMVNYKINFIIEVLKMFLISTRLHMYIMFVVCFL